MGRKVTQTNFTGGVADPLLVGREDQNFYYNSVQQADNVVVQPQGGMKRRGGLKSVSELSSILSQIDLSGATLSAPQGGVVANIHDGDLSTNLETTANVATNNPYVIVRVDFGAATAVDLVDIENYKLSSGFLDNEFFVQYSSDDVVWSDFGSAFNVDDRDRSRRRKGNAGQVVARYWRLVRIGSTDTPATVSVGEMKFWAQTSNLSNGRLAGFAYSTDEAYMMVVSDRSVDVLSGVDCVGSIAVPYQTEDLSVLNWTQSLDTMLLWHEDYAPQRIYRQGGDDEFDYRDVSFVNIPQHDYGAGVGGVDEVQTLNDAGTFVSGNDITISVEGERTEIITGGASRAVSAANIQAALRALDNTSTDGITVTDNALDFEVTFGGEDGARSWVALSVSVNTGNSVWSVSRKTKGKYPGEDIMSDARGWPSTGTFYQQRLWLGGISGLRNALLASVVGITDAEGNFDMNIDQDDDARGLLLRASTDQVSAIHQIVPGRNLTIFTEDTEFYIPTEPIDINAVLKLATRRGIKEGLRVYDLDGALAFVQADGSSLREFIFVDTEQSYDANNISVLSSHLLNDPIDVALRKAVNTDETDLLLLVNSDGTTTAVSTLRKELVTAFTKWFTRTGDKFLSVGVDKNKNVYFITERIINGEPRRFVEMMDNDMLLDGGGQVVIASESYTVTADQVDFNYTFDNPAPGSEAIGVRVNGVRLDESEYTVDTGTKTVSLDVSAAAGDIVRIASMVKVISGLDYVAGEDVQTYIDGSPGSTYTVGTDGVLTLDRYADTSIQYGFFFDVYIKLMNLRIAGAETLAGEMMRVYRLILSLYQTGHIEVRCNGGSWRDVPLLDMDKGIMDKSMDDLLVDGEIDLKGISGWKEGGEVEFRQTVPSPFNVRSVVREVSL